MKETYITIEQAKALKELGFPINNLYLIESKGVFTTNFKHPTLSLVQKWLREEKEMLISMNYSIVNKTWTYRIDRPCYNGLNRPSFDTYEQALSAGIDKCIEILNKN